MRNSYLLFLALFFTFSGFTQQRKNTSNNQKIGTNRPVDIKQATNFRVINMQDYPQVTEEDNAKLTGKVIPKNGITLSSKRKSKLDWINSAGKSPTSLDPYYKPGNLKNTTHNAPERAPIVSFEGLGLDVSPPDPSVAVGPNHVVLMENGQWAVYDKTGTMASGFPKNLGDPLGGGNEGDPVVIYDREADRWFISQFQDPLQTTAQFIIAISQTPDPTGTYYVYNFSPGHGNDYPHYGIWGDSYVVAGNFDGNSKIKAFNRTKMLAGDNTAEMVAFTPPGLAGTGFIAPMPVHSEAAGAATGPAKVLYYQDDAFSGVSTDHIGLWNLTMDWANTSNSTISNKIQIPTIQPFDAVFAGGFAVIAQPGTSQRIDVIMGAIMNMSQWYKFPNHESIILNWAVEVNDGSQVSGIRWVELRSTDNGTSWSIYKEGTFTDPTGNEAVWMGCMSMDKQGNIGMGYTKSGTITRPSIYYTGLMANESVMGNSVGENLVMAGTTVCVNERYGDYGQAIRDPNDDLTFWVTSEYSGGPDKKVRVYSFKIGNNFTNDVGISAINTPNSGSGLTATEAVQVTIKNFGTASQSNIPVELKLGGSTIVTETYTGTIAAGATATFNMVATVDLSTVGSTYNLEACTTLAGDENVNNNCTSKAVQHVLGDDVGVIAITAPNSGSGLGATETITITVRNFGGNSQSNIPVQFTINGGTPVSGTVPGPIASGATENYNFPTTADLSANGSYNICAKTSLVGDQLLTNDETCKIVNKISCLPATTNLCNADGIKQFELGTISVDDGADGCNTEGTGSPQGFADRTHLTTDLERSTGNNIHTLKARYNYDGGTDIKLSAWIDFNDNGTFETSERLINDATFSAFGSLADFTLTIPTTANLGSHRMRVRAGDSTGNPGAINDPCSNLEYGETQDYTVNVIDQTLNVNENTIQEARFDVINTVSNQYEVTLTTERSVGAMNINVYNALGQRLITAPMIKANGKYTHQLNLAGKAVGVYVITVSNNMATRSKKIIVK